MLRKALYVSVNPYIMKWARESAGLDEEAVARRLDITVKSVKEWEDGIKKPTLKTLELLSSFYKRPLATFFLPEPPTEPPLPTDFRVLPEEQKHPLSKKARFAIRRTRWLQSLATELIGVAGREATAKIERIDLTEDPEEVAARERKAVGVGVEDQLSWGSDYTAFGLWRESLENLNILVFQVSIPIEEARGFSLLDNLLPAIVVNAADSVRARIFTLFHEYAHLLLGTSGICIPSEALHIDVDVGGVERFCNHFAGAFLVPKIALSKDEDAKTVLREARVDDIHIDRIAARFKVSRQVILRRMLICGFISKQQYEGKLAEWRYPEKPPRRSFGVNPAQRCVLENGRLFVSLALEAKAKELITYSDIADYLSIKLKYLAKVEAFLLKKR